MSEYKEFLSYFKSKRKGDEAAGQRPAQPAESADPLALAAETAEPAFTPSGQRQIRTGEAEPIPTGGSAEASSGEAAVDTLAERLEPEAEGRAHTGNTGKIGAVSAGAEGDGREADGTKTVQPSLFETSFASRGGAAEEEPEAEGSTKPIVMEPSSDLPADAADARPTRTIPAGKASLLMEIAKSSAEETGEDPDQLKLEGFFDNGEETKEKDAREEKELQKEVRKTRQKLINDFHFWTKAKQETGDSPDGALGSDKEKKAPPRLFGGLAERFEGMESGFLSFRCEEFKDPNDHRGVFKTLMDIRRYTLARAGIVALLGLILLIINIAASVSAAKHNGFFTILGGSDTAYLTVNLLFLAAAALLTADDLKNGVISLLQGHPKTDTSLVFMLSAALLQVIAAFLTEQNIESTFHMMTGAVVLLCAPLLLAKTFYYDNTRHCFKSIAANSEKSYLRTLSDRGLIASVLAESDNGGGQVVYPGRTRFIKNFIRRSRASAAGGQISSRVTLIAAGVAFLVGVLAMIVRKNVMWGLSAMCFSSALAFPLGCIFFTGFMIANENQSLSVKSSFVRSYSDARDLASVSNIVLRAEDLFNVQITESVCATNVSQKQAEFCAGLLTRKTGGLLAKAFLDAEGLQMENLPEVEKCAYEDKLGFSAWINDCRVLLGSNTFLVNHNVRMPDESGVLNFIDTENKPLYLAIEGHFTAMFSARYTCASEYVKCLKPLAENGANILIVSSDPNITDGFAEQLLGLPADSVRVISKKAADKLTSYQNTVTDAEDTGIVFTDAPETLCRCAYSAVKLDKLKKLSKLICEICCCAGVALGAVFALLGTVSAVTGWLAAVLQAVGMALCFFLPPLLTASSLPAFRKSAVRPVPVGDPVTPEDYPARPRKIEDEPDEPDEDEALPEEDDADVKIAPEGGRKRRFGRAFSALQLNDSDFDDYDEEDGEEEEPEEPSRHAGRFSSALRSRFGKRGAEEDEEDGDDGYDVAEEEAPRRSRTVIPDNPDDIHLSTEELLKSRYFAGEDDDVRREPSPVNEYEEEDDADGYEDDADGYDDYDDYDDYGDDAPLRDGLLSRLRGGRKRGARSGRRQGGQPRELIPRGLSEKVRGLSSRLPFTMQNEDEEEDWDDEDWEEEETDEEALPEQRRTFLTSSAPAVGRRRRDEEETESVPSLRPSILSFAQPDPAPPKYELGKTDEYDFLNVKFEPPAVNPRDFYSDSYFRRYETPDAPAGDAAAPDAARPAGQPEKVTAGKVKNPFKNKKHP